MNNENIDTCRNGLHDWAANKRWTGTKWLCDPCLRAKARRYAASHPRPSTPAGRARAIEAAAASKRRYPEKVRARSKVQREIQAGRLVRPDACNKCALPCAPEAAHDDYSKPLDVEWLCKKCHADKDRGMHVRPAN